MIRQSRQCRVIFRFLPCFLLSCAWGQTPSPSPSVEETVAYINAHAFESGAQGTAYLAVSNDGEKIVLTEKNTANIAPVEVYIAPIRYLNDPDISDNVLEIQCKGHLPCITKTLYDIQGNPLPSLEKRENPKMMKYVAAGYIPDDPEKAGRVKKAYQHILDLLNAQYQAKHPEPPESIQIGGWMPQKQLGNSCSMRPYTRTHSMETGANMRLANQMGTLLLLDPGLAASLGAFRRRLLGNAAATSWIVLLLHGAQHRVVNILDMRRYMKTGLPTLLLVILCVLGRPLIAQDQSSVAPTLEQTLDFLNNHRHGYYSECVNSDHTDSQGYITAEFHEVRTLDINNVSSANGSLVFKYASGGYMSSTRENIDSENRSITFVLPSIRLASLVVEENPAESDCREGHAVGASNCGGHPCPAVPYHFSIDTPYWVRLRDGKANTFQFGLPVMTRDEGERVVKAILHLIELSGGQTKEVF
jgi:hypothetical protein